MPSQTPIQPLLVGGNDEALALSARLAAAGLLVPAIRPPTVPQGTARLRISLSADHSAGRCRRVWSPRCCSRHEQAAAGAAAWLGHAMPGYGQT